MSSILIKKSMMEAFILTNDSSFLLKIQENPIIQSILSLNLLSFYSFTPVQPLHKSFCSINNSSCYICPIVMFSSYSIPA